MQVQDTSAVGVEERALILATLTEHSEVALNFLADRIAHLGARLEWSGEDNWSTTEGIATLAAHIGLPAVGDQDDEALAFYERADS